MKNIKYLFVILIVTLLMSCGDVDKTLVNNINTFESQWKTLVSDFDQLETNLKTESDTIISECESTCSAVPATIKDAKLKATIDSLMEICNTKDEERNSILQKVADYKTQLAEQTKSFGEWKEKVLKGEVKLEEANRHLDELKTSLMDGKDFIDTLKSTFSEINNNCKTCCNEIEKATASLTSSTKIK